MDYYRSCRLNTLTNAGYTLLATKRFKLFITALVIAISQAPVNEP